MTANGVESKSATIEEPLRQLIKSVRGEIEYAVFDLVWWLTVIYIIGQTIWASIESRKDIKNVREIIKIVRDDCRGCLPIATEIYEGNVACDTDADGVADICIAGRPGESSVAEFNEFIKKTLPAAEQE